MQKKAISVACARCGIVFERKLSMVLRSRRSFCGRTCQTEAAAEAMPERFWSKVDKSGDCWLWTGARQNMGYGHLSVRKRWRLAHRVAWELVRGPIPEGLNALHVCDTPLCVRPDHLFLGTFKDNMVDRAVKGRTNQAKLTPGMVREVRRRAAAGESKASIGRSLRVTPTCIGAVVSGTTWRHVGDAERPHGLLP